ncbi:MAG: ABC transporter substrate-binding protein, partial [Bacteroidota bacterium]
MKHLQNIFLICVILISMCIISCIGELPEKNEVICHGTADPEMLNPINFTDAESGYITNHIFQKLIDVDFRNPTELVPILAESRPQIEKTPDGKMIITFRIRKETRWDNGSPVTAKDVEFTIKT